MPERFDVVIVGARCAGASLAAYLSEAGRRVLLLDADPLPSDTPMSTHLVQPPGMDELDALGVGERVRAAAPPTRRMRMQMDGVGLTADLRDRPAYCIRREKLDAWLQQAALARGAQLRDRTKVVELVRDGGRVAGVIASSPSGRYEVRARLVVGADGAHSTVARLTGAEEYLACDATRGGYWFYWPKPEVWDSAAYPYDSIIAHEGSDVLYVFQCDGELLVLAVGMTSAAARAFGARYRERYLEWLARSAVAAPLIQRNEPIGRGMGLLNYRFFYRRPVGAGFALVGDAGHVKDFITGQDITDALLGARDLALAIRDGRQEAFDWYWRQRDASTLALYFDALAQGSAGANNPLSRWLLDNIGHSAELCDRVVEIIERRRSPFDLIEPQRLLRWVGAALLHGRFELLAKLLERGARDRTQRAQLRRRLSLARRALQRLDPPLSAARFAQPAAAQ